MTAPTLSGVWPDPSDTSVPLKPAVRMEFVGPGLIDPLTFGSGTFGLYGPGDVVYDTGPGTILNSGIQSDPYVLIDGAVIRERIDGTWRVYTSGLPPASGVDSSSLGVSGTMVIAEFIPSVPLNAFTDYTAVLVGADALAWTTTSRVFTGVTTWTSEAEFSGIGTSLSGNVDVVTPYTRTLQTALYESTSGYNDTYRITITSGSTQAAPKFTWSQDSSPGIYASSGVGPHDMGEGLTFKFRGTFYVGEQFSLDVHIPAPLANSYAWSFTTARISGSEPPSESEEPQLIIDQTPDGSFTPVTSDDLSGPRLVSSTPAQMAYGVSPSTSYILLEFDRAISSVDASGITISASVLMDMPNISDVSGTITPSGVEVSGVYVKVWL